MPASRHPRMSSVPEAVDRAGQRDPGAPALVDQDQRVDYATLVAASATLAKRLRAAGVGPGVIVPLLVPRSAELAVLQLAVLRTGAAYTTIDVGWPVERVQSILARVESPVVVGLTGTPAVTMTVGTESLDAMARQASGPSSGPSSVDPRSAACVFFTSGSTGVPKGVLLPHAALTRMFGSGGLAGFGPGHASPVMAPPAWDMYGFELWGQLVSGGAAVVVREDHPMPRRLRQLVTDEGVDTAWLTTTLFNVIVDEDVDGLSGFSTLYVGGERLSPRHVAAFLDRFGEGTLWNGYGPAENGMLTTVKLLTRADADVPGGVPIGRPVPGTDVVLLDPQDRPVPVGTQGEITATGSGVALGYLGDEPLTASRFAPLALDGVETAAYRTGDFGVFDADGTLHYRGRRDRQVKVRGHRIELDEIEAAAGRVPGVGTCAAVGVEGRDGQIDAVALYFTVVGTGTTPRDLRTGLGSLLPRYAVPDRVQQVAALPRAANGKVDLRGLGTTASS